MQLGIALAVLQSIHTCSLTNVSCTAYNSVIVHTNYKPTKVIFMRLCDLLEIVTKISYIVPYRAYAYDWGTRFSLLI